MTLLPQFQNGGDFVKFSGKVGFLNPKYVETNPGVYRPEIVEKPYVGDVLRDQRRFQPGDNQQNENLVVSNRISIVSDLYMKQNWGSIKYVVWNAVNWSVSSIDVSQYPRVLIDLGGVYNGQTSTT